MGERRQRVGQPGRRQGPQRVQRLAGQHHPSHRPRQARTSSGAHRKPDKHLERELAAGGPGRRPPGRCAGGQQRRHQGDANRVIGPRLPLQEQPGTPSDIPPTEHREDHRRIRRRQRGPQQQRNPPIKSEHQVSGRGQRPGCDQGSGNTQPRDRRGLPPEAVKPDSHAAVEEDQHQRHGHDALHLFDRGPAEPGEPVGRQSRPDQEHRGSGHPEPPADRAGHDGERGHRADCGDHCGERRDVTHRRATNRSGEAACRRSSHRVRLPPVSLFMSGRSGRAGDHPGGPPPLWTG